MNQHLDQQQPISNHNQRIQGLIQEDEMRENEERRKKDIHEHLQIQMRKIIKQEWDLHINQDNGGNCGEQVMLQRQKSQIMLEKCKIQPQNQIPITTILTSQKEPPQKQSDKISLQNPQDNYYQQQRYLPFDDIFKKQIRQYIIDNLHKQKQQLNQRQGEIDNYCQFQEQQITQNIEVVQQQSQQNHRDNQPYNQQKQKQKQQKKKKDDRIDFINSKCQVIEIEQQDNIQIKDNKNDGMISQINKNKQQTLSNNQNNSQPQNSFTNTPMQQQHIKNIIYSINPQLSSQIISHNSTIVNKTNEPSVQELKKLDNQLKLKFPTLNIAKIIQIFHSVLHENCQHQFDQQNHNSSTSQIQNFVVISDTKSNPLDYTKSNIILRNKLSNHLIIDSRLLQQKKIAISFLKFGYGLRVLRQQINDDNITNTRYNNTITVIIRTSFRKMQEYMAAYHKNIVIINSQEEKIMRAPLINCQKWMPPQQLETYYKFIKLVFSIQIVQITEGETVKLHQTCMKQLKLRLQHDDRDFKRKKKESKINTGKMDRFKNIIIKNGANLSINPVASNFNQPKKIILNQPKSFHKPFTTFQPQKSSVAIPQKPIINNNQVVIPISQNITSNQSRVQNIEKDQKNLANSSAKPKSVQFILGNISQTNSIHQKVQTPSNLSNSSISTINKNTTNSKPQFFPKPILKKTS